MKFFFALLLAIPGFSGMAQRVVDVQLEVGFAGEVLELNNRYYNADSTQWVTFTKVQFYWSPSAGSSERGPYHLVDWADSKPVQYRWEVDQLPEKVEVIVGVDSLTNSEGAKGGDLDPIHGMYWTWNSGYIHVKLEGTASWSQARKQRFMYHLGGYQGEHQAIAHRSFDWPEKAGKLTLLIPLDELVGFEKPDYGETVMSPGKTAALLTQKMAASMQVK